MGPEYSITRVLVKGRFRCAHREKWQVNMTTEVRTVYLQSKTTSDFQQTTRNAERSMEQNLPHRNLL